jgi:hypothetical protein
MNRAIPLVLVLGTLALSGCATRPPVTVSRDAGVELAKGERVAVVLASHETCENDECERESTASSERTFASCLTDGIDGATVLRAGTIRDHAFPKVDFEATPRTFAEWQNLLQNAEFRRAIEPLNLRYVAFAKVESRAYYRSLGGASIILVTAFGRASTTTSSFDVELLDMKSGRRAGSLHSSKTGNGGFVMALVLVVPVLIVPWWTRTESLTCAAVATELASFVKLKDASR